jgi:DNA-binding PadR family transcriptional regulator
VKPSNYYILLALGADERHGYAIMQAVGEMTDGRETILPGTLYAALARMTDEGLVESREADAEDASGGPKRRYYRATRAGRAAAREESERLRALVEIARKQKLLPGGRK